MTESIKKTPDEWRKQLNPEQYHVTREKGTERPFTGAYYKHSEIGTYCCVCCGADLYSSETKFESGSGWPSFWAPVTEDSLKVEADETFGMVRHELLCANCDAHLGHVFPDGPLPTGARHCINSASLSFKAKESK